MCNASSIMEINNSEGNVITIHILLQHKTWVKRAIYHEYELSVPASHQMILPPKRPIVTKIKDLFKEHAHTHKCKCKMRITSAVDRIVGCLRWHNQGCHVIQVTASHILNPKWSNWAIVSFSSTHIQYTVVLEYLLS